MSQPRNSEKARRICIDTHGKYDVHGKLYMVCSCGCGGKFYPINTAWRADHARRHAEDGPESAENLWPIMVKCDAGPGGKAAQDTVAVAKGKRWSRKAHGVKQKTGRGFYRPADATFDWSTGRYRRAGGE